MTKQYFMNQPEVQHQERHVIYEYDGVRFNLETDNGVFSKTQVDYGSKVLVEAILTDVIEDNIVHIIELGSGYGPISLMLAKHFSHAQVVGIEVNQRAVQLSQKNAESHHVMNVSFIEGDAMEWQERENVDIVVTNPPIRAGKSVIQAFVNNAHRLLKVTGILYVVIQKKQGAPSMVKHMEALFGNVEKLTQDKGYWILKSVK